LSPDLQLEPTQIIKTMKITVKTVFMFILLLARKLFLSRRKEAGKLPDTRIIRV
jgi:hypothetical protein